MNITLDENKIWEEYRHKQANKLKNAAEQKVIRTLGEAYVAQEKKQYQERKQKWTKSSRKQALAQFRQTPEYTQAIQDQLARTGYQDIYLGKRDSQFKEDFKIFRENKYQEALRRTIAQAIQDTLSKLDQAALAKQIFEDIQIQLTHVFMTQEVDIYPDRNRFYTSNRYDDHLNHPDTLTDLIDDPYIDIFVRVTDLDYLDHFDGYDNLYGIDAYEVCCEKVRQKLIEINALSDLYDLTKDSDWDVFCNHAQVPELFYEINIEVCDQLQMYFDRPRMLELLSQNPHYKATLQEYTRQQELAQKLYSDILTTVPDNIAELYPNARNLTRKFIIHEGPTNSGKTHEAMQLFTSENKGIYLAPLRLLAYEQFERLNQAGLKTNLVTGEELRIIEDARHTAATIEMLDEFENYDVAVIDECQMLSDQSRGGAWVRAILGVCAKQVHICTAPEATELITKIIQMCNDQYKIVHHERQTRLSYYPSRIKIPQDLKKGDALIVFSRQSVHRLAAELQKKKMKCSIIYGNLPYNVRHEEARKFSSGETDILVATDAIGMGLNLPIRRIIFVEHTKFDGTKNRTLTAAEIKQIAGRAGRYGIYDEGFYAAYEGGYLKHLSKQEVPATTNARVAFPQSLIQLNGPLSEILMQWDKIPLAKIFKKEAIDNQLKLAQKLEKKYPLMNKMVMLKFCFLPFDLDKPELLQLWFMCVQMETEGKIQFCFKPIEKIKSASGLEEAEARYKELDLIYQFCRVFGHAKWYKDILNEKHLLSQEITAYLATSPLKPKKCRECGKDMPWYHRFPMCDKCHDMLYRQNYWYSDKFYGYEDDFDDDFDDWH